LIAGDDLGWEFWAVVSASFLLSIGLTTVLALIAVAACRTAQRILARPGEMPSDLWG
jgi:hypothetical protein